MALDVNGFYRPSYDEIVASMEQKAKELLGEDIDTSALSVLGKFLRITAYDISEAYNDLETTYYARFPNTSSGISLDRLCVFAGITRNPATYARHNITVTGTPDTTVGMGGLLVGNDDNLTFYNENDFTIGSSGTVTIIVAATESGSIGNVDSINTIINPVTGVTGITYIGLEEQGNDTESDYDLRKRFSQAVSGAGSCNVDAIRGYISRISGVESVVIVENDTNQTDSDGRPAHSFEVYVYGNADEQEIAEAIFLKKPLGITSVSTADSTHKVSQTVIDKGGYEHAIYFSKVSEVPITITVTIKTNITYTQDGAAAIKNNLVAYVDSLGVGGSVVTSAMYSHVFEVTGVTEVVSITQAKSGQSESSATIVCSQSEVPTASATNITVVVANT